MSRRRALLTQVAAGPSFFGNYSMLREFWAEDPDWSNPGDGNAMTTWRDAGTLDDDLSATTNGGGNAPKYVASGINGKPSISFDATAENVGGCLFTAAGRVDPPFSVVVVGLARTTPTAAEYFTDSDDRHTNRAVVGLLSSTWRGGNSFALDAGTSDTVAHVFTLTVASNDLELFVDGVSVGTDTSGTAVKFNGLTVGANNVQINQFLDGLIPYVAVFDGDIVSQTGYSDWLAEIIDYYGIT